MSSKSFLFPKDYDAVEAAQIVFGGESGERDELAELRKEHGRLNHLLHTPGSFAERGRTPFEAEMKRSETVSEFQKIGREIQRLENGAADDREDEERALPQAEPAKIVKRKETIFSASRPKEGPGAELPAVPLCMDCQEQPAGRFGVRCRDCEYKRQRKPFMAR